MSLSLSLSLSLSHAPRVSRARTMHAAVVLYIHPNLSSSSVVAEKTHGFFPWLKRGARRHHVCARWRVSAPNKSRADLISDWCSQDGCMRNLFSYCRIRACNARDTRGAGDETQGVQPLLGFFFSNSVRTLKSLARTLGPVQTTNRVPPPFCVLLQLCPISVLCDDRHDFDC